MYIRFINLYQSDPSEQVNAPFFFYWTASEEVFYLRVAHDTAYTRTHKSVNTIGRYTVVAKENGMLELAWILVLECETWLEFSFGKWNFLKLSETCLIFALKLAWFYLLKLAETSFRNLLEIHFLKLDLVGTWNSSLRLGTWGFETWNLLVWDSNKTWIFDMFNFWTLKVIG